MVRVMQITLQMGEITGDSINEDADSITHEGFSTNRAGYTTNRRIPLLKSPITSTVSVVRCYKFVYSSPICFTHLSVIQNAQPIGRSGIEHCLAPSLDCVCALLVRT